MIAPRRSILAPCPFFAGTRHKSTLFSQLRVACRINSSPPLSPRAPEAFSARSARSSNDLDSRETIERRLISQLQSDVFFSFFPKVPSTVSRGRRETKRILYCPSACVRACGKSTRRKFRIQPSVHWLPYYNRVPRLVAALSGLYSPQAVPRGSFTCFPRRCCQALPKTLRHRPMSSQRR